MQRMRPRNNFINLKSGLLITMLGSLLVSGCGGGSASGTALTTPVTVFATDNLSSHDHVWVNLFQIDLVNSSGATVNVFTSTTGEIIDLRSLRDATGARFQMLSNLTIPAGTYTGAKITVGEDVTLYPSGATTGTPKKFESGVGDPSAKKVISLTFATPKTLGTTAENVVLDFDLSQWAEIAGKVRPVVVDGSHSGLDDPARHEHEDFHGLVADLSGTPPTQSFSLTLRNGGTIGVDMSADTVVYREDATLSPSLANADKVEVQGTFNPTTKRIAATSIKIEGESSSHSHEGHGKVISSDATACTLVVQVLRAGMFAPDRLEVTVQASDTTIFRSNGGIVQTKTEWFAALAGLTTPEIEMEGSYNSSSGIFTATKLKMHTEGSDDPSGGHEVEAKGAVSNVNATLYQFTLTPSEWEGMSWSPNRAIVVNGATCEDFEDPNGETLSKSDWFAALATVTRAKAYGKIVDGVFVATRLRLVASR